MCVCVCMFLDVQVNMYIVHDMHVKVRGRHPVWFSESHPLCFLVTMPCQVGRIDWLENPRVFPAWEL